MSSRYVWQRSNVAYTAAYSAMDVESSSYMGSGYYRIFQGVPDYTFSEWTGGPAGGLSEPVYAAVASSFTMRGNRFKLTNPAVTESEPYDDGSGLYELSVPITTLDSYFYFVTSDSSISASTTFTKIYRVKATANRDTIYAGVCPHNTYGNSRPCLEFTAGMSAQVTSLTFEEMTATGTKGTANGTVSNSASSTYPPRDYVSKSARIWPYSVPFMRCSGRSPEYATKPLELDALSR